MKKLLVDGFTTKIACPTGSFRVLVYPSGVDVSTSTLRYLSACLRTRRRAAGTERPDALYADRGYDHDKYRKQGREAGIKPVIARRGEQHDSGWACTAGSLSRASPYCTGSAGSASAEKSATTSTKPSSASLRHHLLAPPPHLQELGVLLGHRPRRSLAVRATAEGAQVGAPFEAAKRVPRRRTTACLSCETWPRCRLISAAGYIPELLPLGPLGHSG